MALTTTVSSSAVSPANTLPTLILPSLRRRTHNYIIRRGGYSLVRSACSLTAVYRGSFYKRKCRSRGVQASLFGVGAPEALVIGVVALLVFGPKGLAEAARSLGKSLRAFQPTLRELQEVSREFKSTLEQEIGLNELRSNTLDPYKSDRQMTQNDNVTEQNGQTGRKVYSVQDGVGEGEQKNGFQSENMPKEPEQSISPPSATNTNSERSQVSSSQTPVSELTEFSAKQQGSKEEDLSKQ
eukprot:TRINITY_DN2320_c0_g1_i3.p1 TRINITY_DN2320_c0_g1~~TRINITY_DN2320_c0_g1_i3.p1  ORF type:complete len:240 (-),score=46.89 TRINITY_DN2320_c0_g1_i3:327-1046(-)